MERKDCCGCTGQNDRRHVHEPQKSKPCLFFFFKPPLNQRFPGSNTRQTAFLFIKNLVTHRGQFRLGEVIWVCYFIKTYDEISHIFSCDLENDLCFQFFWQNISTVTHVSAIFRQQLSPHEMSGQDFSWSKACVSGLTKLSNISVGFVSVMLPDFLSNVLKLLVWEKKNNTVRECSFDSQNFPKGSRCSSVVAAGWGCFLEQFKPFTTHESFMQQNLLTTWV